MHAKTANGDTDAEVAQFAARQHGVVSLRQLERLGVRKQGRATRVRNRRLHRVHRGVYAVGHPGLGEHGRWMAAVLACGPGAVLSHTSAARLWRLLRQPRAEADPGRHPAVHVTVPSEAGREHRDGIRVHRSRTLLPSEVTRRDGIPVTTPTRTLTDLRRILPQPQFAAARRQAEYLGLHIDAGLEPDRTHSELEARLLALCRRHRLPRPQVNVRVGPFLVDFLWSEQRLIVEVDGYRHHGSRNAFESDRARDLELKLRGFEVIRFTWRRLTAEPAQTVAALRRLLWERPHPAD